MQDHDLLIRIDEKVDALYKAVMGDEQPGLIQKVSALEQFKGKVVAVGSLIGLAVSAFGATLIKHLFSGSK